ncbi:unnamed protein product [Arabidopsis lyrata]|nr:unnamed protein product [Arabidopsis lyrata]
MIGTCHWMFPVNRNIPHLHTELPQGIVSIDGVPSSSLFLILRGNFFRRVYFSCIVFCYSVRVNICAVDIEDPVQLLLCWSVSPARQGNAEDSEFALRFCYVNVCVLVSLLFNSLWGLVGRDGGSSVGLLLYHTCSTNLKICLLYL